MAFSGELVKGCAHIRHSDSSGKFVREATIETVLPHCDVLLLEKEVAF